MIFLKLKSFFLRVWREVKYTLFKAAPFPDMEKEFLVLYRKCRPYTMTSIERMYALYKAVEYVSANGIPGDIVECGVFKGGSSMLSALALRSFHSTDKTIYLYDTFSGMSRPTERDRTHFEASAMDHWKGHRAGRHNKWCYAPLDAVRENMVSTGYPKDRIKLIEGKVEDTLPETAPERIALLRLDTDWYESTYHELVHLYPRLADHGIIIIDDYGHWKGAREAVDQYFKEKKIKIFLNRIDYTGRIGVKV